MQINDTTTLIFGGSSSSQAIVTYDWRNSQYTSHTPGITIAIHITYYRLQVIPVTCGVSQPVGRGVFLVGRQNVLILFKIIISCKNIFFSKYQLYESFKEEN